jgi:hypothetical protein
MTEVRRRCSDGTLHCEDEDTDWGGKDGKGWVRNELEGLSFRSVMES